MAFAKRDILTLSDDACRYDIIVSNPPYIADSERKAMEPNVLDYEPATALFVPDADPLRFYRAIARYGLGALRQDGRLYFEINSRFSAEMRQMLEAMGYVDVEVRPDISRRPRFVRAVKGRRPMVKRQLTYESALARAASLCSRGEHAEAEMRRKLRQWGAETGDADRVVEWLVDNGFIDNSRYAHAFVYDKSRFDLWGRVKIRHQLRLNGVAGDVVEEAMAEIDEDEYVANLRTLLAAKKSHADGCRPLQAQGVADALWRVARL